MATENEWTVPVSAERMHTRDGYSLSKWMAEHIVRSLWPVAGSKAAASQPPALPVQLTVYRPGTVMAHSTTGHCNPSDFFPRYLSAVVELKAAVDESGRYEFTPVDFMAAAIVTIAAARQVSGTGATLPVCYHIVNDPANLMTFGQIGRAIVARGRGGGGATSLADLSAVSVLPFDEWRARFGADRSNSLYALSSFVTRREFFRSAAAQTATANTVRVLRAATAAAAATGVGVTVGGDTKAAASAPASVSAALSVFPVVTAELIGVYMTRIVKDLVARKNKKAAEGAASATVSAAPPPSK
jgi:hypothetical protein